jgi:predicted nucleotidyltransferase
MLSVLITSKSRVELLTWFMAHPGERFHYLQLDRLLKASRHSLQIELKRLLDAGILLSSKEANVRFYWVNEQHPLYPELRSIVFKTSGLGDFLRESLEAIGSVEVALVFGSAASNSDDATSDVDLLVLGEVDMDALNEAVTGAEDALGREINPAVYTREEWATRVRADSVFATDILAGSKVFLIGDDDGLRRTA